MPLTYILFLEISLLCTLQKKTLMLGKIEGRRRRGRQRMRWHHRLDECEFEQAPGEIVEDGKAWRAAVHKVVNSRTQLSKWTAVFLLHPYCHIHQYFIHSCFTSYPIVWISALPFTITYLPNAGFSKSQGRSQLFRIRNSPLLSKSHLAKRSQSCRKAFPIKCLRHTNSSLLYRLNSPKLLNASNNFR